DHGRAGGRSERDRRVGAGGPADQGRRLYGTGDCGRRARRPDRRRPRSRDPGGCSCARHAAGFAGGRRPPRGARRLGGRSGRRPSHSRHRRGGRALGALARRASRRGEGAGGRRTSPLQRKLKVTGPVVVTANRLGDGAVVYRSADGSWTKDLAAAAVVTTTPAAIELLTAALADKLKAVDAYVAPVEL